MKKIYIIPFALLFSGTAFAQRWQSLEALPGGNALTLTSVSFRSPGTGFAVGTDGKIIKTADNGGSWITLPSGTSESLTSVFIPEGNESTVYAVGGHHSGSENSGGVILKSPDNGNTWELIGTNFCLNSVFFTDEMTGYAVGEYLLKTKNGGSDWIVLNSGNPVTMLYSVFFTGPMKGFAVGEAGTILMTDDGGESWVMQASGTNASLRSVSFPEPGTGFVAGTGGTILRTTNGGSEWNILNSGITSDLKSVYFRDVKTGYVVGSEGIILKTTDGGNTWVTENSGIRSGLCSVFTANEAGIAVGEEGTILRSIEDHGHGIGLEELTGDPIRIKIFPNPASYSLTIETTSKDPYYNMSILSLSGREVMQQIITDPVTPVDVGPLTNGIYIVRLTGDDGMRLWKFIKE